MKARVNSLIRVNISISEKGTAQRFSDDDMNAISARYLKHIEEECDIMGAMITCWGFTDLSQNVAGVSSSHLA